jgi:hypothetical protein
MHHVSFFTLIVMALAAVIMGMVMGVSLVRPRELLARLIHLVSQFVSLPVSHRR